MSEAARVEDPERDPRVYLAGERTFLAWIRTGLAMMGFGFVVARLGLFLRELTLVSHRVGTEEPSSLSLWIGVLLILLGAAVTAAAGVRHARFKKRFERGDKFEIPHELLLVLLSSGLAALGLGIAVYLLTRV